MKSQTSYQVFKKKEAAEKWQEAACSRKKEFVVMSQWMNIYESGRSSDSTKTIVGLL
jgi:hypothetical protein